MDDSPPTNKGTEVGGTHTQPTFSFFAVLAMGSSVTGTVWVCHKMDRPSHVALLPQLLAVAFCGVFWWRGVGYMGVPECSGCSGVLAGWFSLTSRPRKTLSSEAHIFYKH